MAGGLVFALSVPAPAGLSESGRAAVAVMATCVVLWSSDLLPTGGVAIAAVILLTLTGASRDLTVALSG